MLLLSPQAFALGVAPAKMKRPAKRGALPGAKAGDSLGPFQQLGDVPPAPVAVVVGGFVADHDDALLGPDGREASPRHWREEGETQRRKPQLLLSTTPPTPGK